MKQVFDLIESINEQVMMFTERRGHKPNEVSVSREAYRRLLEMKTDENKIGNLMIGCAPIGEIETPLGMIRLSIDEMLPETEVAVA